MQKIMFNDAYGLTQATIEGRKTMTRRMIPQEFFSLTWDERDDTLVYENDFGDFIDIRRSKYVHYKIGEVVAVAQRYADIPGIENMTGTPGWRNKMFVKAELMPYRIRITGIKAERLQDISDEDCLREGVVNDNKKCVSKAIGVIQMFYPCEDLKECAEQNGWGIFYDTPREAFAVLIDKVSGRGTWAHNPWVVAYEYELVK